MQAGKTKSREVSKAEAARNLILSNIVAGRYAPGKRLPTFVELERELSASRAVLQQALGTLKRDGFVRSVNRQGLYVVSSPPHLHRYGMAMAASPGELGWSQLMSALNNEAHRVEKSDPHARFEFYYGLQDKETCDRTIATLREEIAAHRLAGLLLTPKTFHILDHVDCTNQRVPRVYLWAAENVGLVPRINVDGMQLVRRALQWLKSRGRQRIAIVYMADTTSTMDHQMLFEQTALKLHLPWIQHVGRSHPEFAQDVSLLLMDYSPEARPDGLIIADDTLVQPISRGLIASGVKVGQELDIVAHCNWPWPVESVLPMQRIGFDMREIVRHAMDAIRMQREGKTPLASYLVQAQFEHEMPPDVHSNPGE